ncbi:MAG TPA: hypothetical protein VHI95_02935 [Acidimicrobiales bacterium]|jgi:hypothetical protein|nr:hypothetical protein [Acidimicrobiales bacterium]
MAILAGLVLGTVAGVRGWNVSGWRLLVLPVCLAGLEIIVNVARFGVSAVVVWSVVLVVLTVVATRGARAATVRWAKSRTH